MSFLYNFNGANETNLNKYESRNSHAHMQLNNNLLKTEEGTRDQKQFGFAGHTERIDFDF